MLKQKTVHPSLMIFLSFLLLFLLPNETASQIILFDNHAIERIFQGRTPTLFLFSDNNKKSKQAREVFEELNQQQPELIMSISDANDGFGMYRRLINFLDLKAQDTPIVLFLGEHQQKYIYHHDKIEKQLLRQFVNGIMAGEIEPDIKSAPVPEENSEPVMVLVGSTFRKLILQSDKQYLVNFYAPWCAHCRNMEAAYQQAATMLETNDNLFLAKLDVTDNDVPGLEIEGLPSLLFYAKDKSKGPIHYTGGLKPQQIIEWLKRHVHYPWKQLHHTHHAQQYLNKKQKQLPNAQL